MTVKEIARKDVVTAEPGTSLGDVVKKMRDEDVGSVVIVEDRKPVGIVTDRQIALHLDGGNLGDTPVEDVMSTDLVTIRGDRDVLQALDELKDAGVRRLPIVDGDGKLEGIVTVDDFLVMLEAELSDVGSIVQKQSPRF